MDVRLGCSEQQLTFLQIKAVLFVYKFQSDEAIVEEASTVCLFNRGCTETSVSFNKPFI